MQNGQKTHIENQTVPLGKYQKLEKEHQQLQAEYLFLTHIAWKLHKKKKNRLITPVFINNRA